MPNYWVADEKGIIPFQTLVREFISSENASPLTEIEAALKEKEAIQGLRTISFEISSNIYFLPKRKKINLSTLEFLINKILHTYPSQKLSNLLSLFSLIVMLYPTLLLESSPHTNQIPLHYLLTQKIYRYDPSYNEEYNQEEFDYAEKKIEQLIPLTVSSRNINSVDTKGFTALHHACNLTLIADNLDVQENDTQYEPPKICVFSNKIVTALLQITNININATLPESKKTPLALIIDNRIAEHRIQISPENVELDLYEMGKKIISTLLKNQADIATPYFTDQIYEDKTIETTSLHYGANFLEYDYLKLLIKSKKFNPKPLYQKDEEGKNVLDYILERKNTILRKNICYLLLRTIHDDEAAYHEFINFAITKLSDLNKDNDWFNEKEEPEDETILVIGSDTPEERTKKLLTSNKKLEKFLKQREQEYNEYKNRTVHWIKSFDKFCYRTSEKKTYDSGQDTHFLLKAKRSIVTQANPDTHVATAALSFFITSRFGKHRGVYSVDLGNKFNEHISDLINAENYKTHLEAFEGKSFSVNKEQSRKVSLIFDGPNLAQNFNHSEQAAFKWLLDEANLDSIIKDLITQIDDFDIYNTNGYKVKAVILHIDSELYMCHHCQPMALALQRNSVFTNQLLISLIKYEFKISNQPIKFTIALSAEKPYVFNRRSNASDDEYRFTEAEHQAISVDLRLLSSEHLFLKDTHEDKMNISAFFSKKDAEKTKLNKKIEALEKENAQLKEIIKNHKLNLQ